MQRPPPKPGAISSAKSSRPIWRPGAPSRWSPAFRRSRTAICTSATPRRSALNFGIAEEFRRRCNLRFDDTNPAKEEQEYIDAIQRDVRWLGFNWDGDRHITPRTISTGSTAGRRILIRAGLAYVDDQSPDAMRGEPRHL